MYNGEKPTKEELPSSRQLLRSTLLALIAAVALLFTVVLPAEYGIDPTGIGRVLDLTEMGEIKQDLAEEAENDDHSSLGGGIVADLASLALGLFVSPAHAEDADGDWREEVTFTLAPGEGLDLKLAMMEGEVVDYRWVAEGGRINFDLHAHGDGRSTTYEKGRGKTDGAGSISAAFDGEHGWFWRNRDKQDVTIVLQVRGDYSALMQN